MIELLMTRGPYLLFVFLMVMSVHIMLSHRNFIKAMVGLAMFQAGIILFFILLAFREHASIPILEHGHGHAEHMTVVNPLPHALMLTAIVVGVATQGVGMALLRRIQAETGTIQDHASDGGAN